MEINVLEKIKKLEDENKAIKAIPSHIFEVDLLNEIVQEVRDELNKLYRDKKIGVTTTTRGNAIFTK